LGFVRIVGGQLRGRRLRVPDRGVRPTSERTREAIFDILGPGAVSEARVLDLFAGTGALGIEALSRGAAHADFLEGNAAVARTLRENLAVLEIESRATVTQAGLDHGTLPPGVRGPWRLVFLDPPYEGGAGPRWIEALARGPWIEAGGIVVYERRKGSPVPRTDALTLATERAYGDTAIVFYRARSPEGPA